MARRALSAVSLALLGTSLATPAHAEERPIRVLLHWTNRSADHGCLDAKALAQATEVRLQRRVFFEQDADLVLDGTLESLDGKRVARLVLRRPNGEMVGRRELESPDQTCATLNEAVPLSVALMVDYQQRVLRLHVPALPSVPAPTPSVAPVQPTEPPRVVDDASWQGATRAGAAAEVGSLPGLAWSSRLALEASRGWPSVRLEAAWLVPRTASFEPGDAAITGWTVGAAGCGAWLQNARLESKACLGAEAGRLLSTGARFNTNRDATSTLGNGWLGANFDVYILADWGAGLDAVVGVPIVKQRFDYDDGGQARPLYEGSRWFARLGLNIVFKPGRSDQKSGR